MPDPAVMKLVNRKFITGVTVVTTMDGDKPRGLAVNAFSSISLDPPMVLVCVAATSSTYESLFRGTHMAINILSTEQLHVVSLFASKSDDKFSGIDWEPGAFGSPIIAGSCAHMEVEVRERLPASTHAIFICRVVRAQVADLNPLIYSSGQFFDSAALAELSWP